MARVTVNQTNFTSGEVSPKCYGRTDVNRYQNGAKSLENCIVNLHGGTQRRPGKLYVATAKFNDKRCRLIPFVFSTTQAYQLEFGHLYMRVYLQSGGQVLVAGVPYEIATPYTEAMLSEMDYTQGADTMFIFHKDVLVSTLKRLAADKWSLQTAPFTTMPFDEIGHTFANTITLSAVTVGTGRTATASAATFLAGDVGRRITHQSGIATITGFSSSTAVTVEIINEFPVNPIPVSDWTLEDSPQTSCTPSAKDPVGAAITLTASADSWRSADVGKFVRINAGLVKITGFSSATIVSAVIRRALDATVASPASAWTLEAPVWNAANGYPCTGVLYEQRLTLAGSKKYPQTVWGSASRLFFDFTLGDIDDDAFQFDLPSTGQINPITKLAATTSLLPLTYGGEFTISGGVEKPLTPSNRQIKSPSVFGCNQVKPVRVGNELLFVQRAGRKVRAFSYKAIDDNYSAPDLTVLAEHITKSGVIDMAYQQEPRSIVGCVLANGRMATLTFDRDEGVIAWTPQITDGFYESVSSNPNATGDEEWCVVRRVIGGVTKRYIERFDETVFTDSAIVGTSVGGATVWTGLGHLEGKQVAVKADGAYLGKFTVTGGEVSIGRDAFVVEIGLPFTSKIIPLRPDLQGGEGSSQGKNMYTSEISLLFSDTIGGKINDVPLSFRTIGPDLLDQPPAEYSGFSRLGLTQWQRGDADIVITQDEPLPFHLLAIIRRITVNS